MGGSSSEESSQKSIKIEPLESERGFRLSGDLDIFSVDTFRRTLELDLHGTLVLDLFGVDFMDDSGLGLLVGAVKRLRERGGSLVLRNVQSEILRTLEITGLMKLPGLTVETDRSKPL
jgi:anti-sigma B factor antagonist